MTEEFWRLGPVRDTTLDIGGEVEFCGTGSDQGPFGKTKFNASCLFAVEPVDKYR